MLQERNGKRAYYGAAMFVFTVDMTLFIIYVVSMPYDNDTQPSKCNTVTNSMTRDSNGARWIHAL